VALIKEEIVKRDARVCVCGKHPTWVKLRGGAVILACPDRTCRLWPAVRGSDLSAAIQTWNEVVANHDAVRKRH
jgi:hypothetical protein